MRKFLISFLLFTPFIICAQTTDDFNDNEITSNPVWYGDTSKFEVLDPPTAGDGSIAASALDDGHVLRSKQNEEDAVITTPNDTAYGEWQFSVADGSGWAISGTNDYFIILISDDSTTANLKDGASLNFNGYYLKFDGDSNDVFNLYKQTGTTEEVIIETNYPFSEDNTSASNGYSIKITRDITGLWSVFIDEGMETAPTTQRGVSVTDNSHTSGSWFGISTNIVTESDTRVLYFDNLLIIKDYDTDVTDPTTQVNAGIIPSIYDTPGEAVEVFAFKISDPGTNDVLPTIISKINIKNTNPVNGADWTDHIQEIIINDGTSDLSTDSVIISDTDINIYITGDKLFVDNASNKEITLSVYLNNSGIEAGKKLQFYIDADIHNWEASYKGSGILANFTADIISSEFTINVAGTHFHFSNVPDSVGINHDFNLTVHSVDENNNADNDATDEITLVLNNGTGNLTSATGLVQNLISGSYDWTDLIYDDLGTFNIAVSASGYTGNTTADIIVISDSVSFVENPAPQIAEGTISSLIDSPGEAISVFKFKVTDSGSGDLLPTDITQIMLKNANPVNGADWTDHIAGIKLTDGSDITVNSSIITDNDITINIIAGNLRINDGESSEVKLQIYLKDTALSDNKILQFYIDKDNHGFIADNSGSTFKSFFASNITSNEFTIDVTATEIEIITQPEQVDIYANFTLSIQSIDENGNLDIDNSESITLSKNFGNGNLSSNIGLTRALTNGTYSWNDLQYTVAEKFRIDVATASYPDILSDTIQAILPFYENTFESGNLNTWGNTDDWAASTNNPVNDSYSLKHNLSGTSGESFISHSMDSASFNSGNIIWRAVLKNGNWDPSSSNKFGFYLMSNSQNLISDTTNGYSVGVHLSGSDNLLKLWKITDDSFTELISSSFDWGTEDVISIEIIRSAKGEWTLKYAENSMFENLIEAGNTTDNAHTHNNYYGVYFKFSSTRAGKFWCDNIKIYEIDDSPFITNVIAIDSVTVQVAFSEDVEQLSAEATGNYSISAESTGPITINSVELDSDNNKIVVLNISELVTDNYTITVNNVKDTASLALQNESFQFSYIIPPVFGDIVINEIMADPIPVVDLPEYDFIELHNTTIYPVYTENWTITIGENEHTFLTDTIPADSFLIVCPSSAVSLFEPYGLTHGILSTTDLTNSGKTILLNDNYGTVINTVTYSDSWYGDPLKDDGGWSLEKIDPLNNCSTSANWIASNDPTGGTPGKINSVFASNIDNTAPLLSSFEIVSASQLKLTFNEIIDTSTALIDTNYIVDNGIGNPDSVTLADEEMLAVNLYFSTVFPDEDTSKIIISGIDDLCGNTIVDTTAEFLFYIVKPHDVVINEIMADPTPVVGLPDYEFVELVNVTNYDLNLNDWTIKIGSYERSLPDISIPADSFAILTSTSGFAAFDTIGLAYGVTSFPSLSNSGAEIVLKDSSGTIISTVTYSDSWYGDPLKDDGGWSLEKIDPLNNCSTSANWIASNDPAGGTPGKTNSVFASNIDNTAPLLSSFEIVSASQLKLIFNEIIDTSTALIETNYTIDNGIGNPDSVILADEEMLAVNLYFSTVFPDEDTSHITISGIDDLCGNTIVDTTAKFLFYIVKPHDVVINEIMADPEPTVGLPEFDYLELYNKTNYDLNLENWTLTIGTRIRYFEDIELKTDSFLIITTESGVDTLSFYGNAIGIISASDLSSTGKEVLLKDKYDSLIYSVNYDKSWYHDEESENGGWSIELIDPNRICSPYYNWTASIDGKGGTPGDRNSVYGENIDSIPPDISNSDIFSPSIIKIEFTEYVNAAEALNVLNYHCSDIGNPDSVLFASNYTTVLTYFSIDFNSGQQYELTILNQTDLCGNITDSLKTAFTYYIYKEGDIVINEIMADPIPSVGLPEYEFIEIYNNSNKIVDLTNWSIVFDDSRKMITEYLFEPGTFLLLCASSADSSLQLFGNTLVISGFPSLPNSGEQISLIDTSGNIIDQITYNTSWYHDDEKAKGGWTIERIDPDNLCGGINNWNASINPDGGTPGIINSIYSENIDTIPPMLLDIFSISFQSIAIKFNEPLKEDIVTHVVNYYVDNEIGFPDSVKLDLNSQSIVYLFFSGIMEINKEYLISIEKVEDLCQNEIPQLIEIIIINKARPYEIIINELMIDPEPVVNLPNAEFIEIYNNSENDYTLNNWSLTVGSTLVEIPLWNLNSNNFLVMTSDASVFSVIKNTQVLEIDNLPSLNNTSEQLVIYDDSMRIISAIQYLKEWYQDEEKEGGGYTLELIDPSNPAGNMNNWRASENQNGGTPGLINSVFENNPDKEPPTLQNILVLSDSSLQLVFNEPLDSTSLLNTQIYYANNGIGYPVIIDPVEPFYDSIFLIFPDHFINDIIYTIYIEGNIMDISGNIIDENTQQNFAIPQEILQNDILINEILFNPAGDGVDYIEIYNNSNKTFDLNDLFLASRDEFWILKSQTNVDKSGYLFFGHEFIVLTTNPEIVKEQYFTTNPNGFIQMQSIPSFSNDAGIVVLNKADSSVIDEFHYNEDMQFTLLNSFDGIALERIDYNTPTNEEANWHSASKSSGYGTPAYENSQHKVITGIEENINIDPEVFSPDEDGYNDVLHIQYKFNDPGYVANIVIFDSRGRFVKNLVKNELLAIEGIFSWDGTNEHGYKASIGLYIIYFEFFDLNGIVKNVKKVCVLGSKL